MKQFVSLLVLCLAVVTTALIQEPKNDNALSNDNLSGQQKEGDPRFGFVSMNEDGTTLSFNSTSIQYAVVIGVVLLILGLVVIPLLGFDLGKIFSSQDDYDNHGGYAYDQDNYYSSYTSYAKRSLNVLSPVLEALATAYTKYE